MTTGFTLVEFLVTLCIVAILSVIAFPAWEHLRVSSEMTAEVNDVLHRVAFARTQALLQRMPITLCASRDHHTCEGEWSEGQIIKSPQAILQVFPPLLQTRSLTWEGVGGKTQLTFFPTGITQNGTFHYCRREVRCVAVIVNRAGRTRVEKN